MKISRLYLVLLLSILLLASTRGMAESPSFTTVDAFNGRMWQLLSSSQKASHLTGIQEGIKLCLNQIKGDLQISAELMLAMKESGIQYFFNPLHYRTCHQLFLHERSKAAIVVYCFIYGIGLPA